MTNEAKQLTVGHTTKTVVVVVDRPHFSHGPKSQIVVQTLYDIIASFYDT